MRKKANWIGHILRRNCLLQQVIEGKIKGQIEVTKRRGRRRKKLLDDLKDKRGYCQLKEEALDRTMWRNSFGRGSGPVVWQITDDDDDDEHNCMSPSYRSVTHSRQWRHATVRHPVSTYKASCDVRLQTTRKHTNLVAAQLRLVITNLGNSSRICPKILYLTGAGIAQSV